MVRICRTLFVNRNRKKKKKKKAIAIAAVGAECFQCAFASVLRPLPLAHPAAPSFCPAAALSLHALSLGAMLRLHTLRAPATATATGRGAIAASSVVGSMRTATVCRAAALSAHSAVAAKSQCGMRICIAALQHVPCRGIATRSRGGSRSSPSSRVSSAASGMPSDPLGRALINLVDGAEEKFLIDEAASNSHLWKKISTRTHSMPTVVADSAFLRAQREEQERLAEERAQKRPAGKSNDWALSDEAAADFSNYGDAAEVERNDALRPSAAGRFDAPKRTPSTFARKRERE